MKEEPLDIFIPPIFTIVSIETSLERNNVIYSRKIRAVHKSGRSYEFIERSNIPVEKYLGTAVECIVEVIEAEFYTPEDEKEKRKLPVTIEKGEYLWTESGDNFIPELVEMVEGHHNDEEYEYDDEEFERLSIDYLKKWGVSGLGLATHQSKPMVRTKEGVFLFNEYQNEEVIEQWERNQTIYFKPIKMLLRGIKIPTATKEKRHYKAKKSIIESQDPSVYKMYNGKNYTESEWKIKEQELWEEYTGNKNKKKENKKQFPPSRFLD